MNVIWITADTFRRDQIGAYGNDVIHTPVLDALAARGTRFDNHYACGFPTMPTRADHHTASGPCASWDGTHCPITPSPFRRYSATKASTPPPLLTLPSTPEAE